MWRGIGCSVEVRTGGLRLEFQGTPSHIGSSVDNRVSIVTNSYEKANNHIALHHNKITCTIFSFVSGELSGHLFYCESQVLSVACFSSRGILVRIASLICTIGISCP
jgi:hypothetical protein